MVTFGSTLSIATSGLNAATARARTAAENIANANTPGYTRRITILEERNAGAQGSGVRVIGVETAKAEFLTKDRMKLAADDAFASTKASAAAQLTAMVGEPGADNGLFRAYTQFENALRDSAATPESTLLQSEALEKARTLTTTIQSLNESANQQRTQADRQIDAIVQDVNEALNRLEELNALPKSGITPAVIDERQRLVDRINEAIPVNVQYREHTMNLVTEGGVFLLTETAHTLEFSTAGNVARSQVLGSPLSGLSIEGQDITPGTGGPQGTRSGQIAALFEVRDKILPDFQDKLDGLSSDLISRFAVDSVDPSKTPGEAGLFTDGTTVPPTGTPVGLAASLTLNAAIDPQQGGEIYRLRDGIGATSAGALGNGDQLNRLVDAFSAQRSAPAVLGIAGSHDAATLAAEITSDIAFQDRNFSEAALFAGTRHDVAVDAEQSVLGVDTDFELQQLLLIEQAYAANARVIQVVGSLLDQLLSIA